MSNARADTLPDYAPMLAAYHRGFASELRRMIDALPIAPGMRVLDMACGDGVYAPWLADRIAPGGEVFAVDINLPYLRFAARAADAVDRAAEVQHVAATLETLPFPPGTFDLAWCAQSFYTLPDPLLALQHLAWAVRSGGFVAVLEDDTLHHVLLPWPPAVEMAIQAAEYRALCSVSGDPRKYYVARRLSRLFRASGLIDVRVHTYAIDRAAPLQSDERQFLGMYLENLKHRVASEIAEHARTEFEHLANPASGDYILDDPDLLVTCIDRVVWGRRP